MSDVVATESGGGVPVSSLVGAAFAIAAAAIWVVAGIVDDGLYAVCGIAGIAGFASGLKGRAEARRVGGWARAASLTALVLGGLLGGSVAVAFVYFVITGVL